MISLLKILISLLMISSININAKSFTYKDIPIQNHGRIKPLDTFSNNQLLSIYGKTKFKQIQSIDWLFELLTMSTASLDQKIFKIENPDVIHSLDLEWRNPHLYNFREIRTSFSKNEALVNNIQIKLKNENNKLELVEKQIWHLYQNKLLFENIYKSTSCLLPLIEINDTTIANILGISPNDFVSPYFIQRNKENLENYIEDNINDNEREHFVEEIDKINSILMMIEHQLSSTSLKLIPTENTEEWLSPWNLIRNNPSQEQMEMILILERLLSSYIKNIPIIQEDLQNYALLISSINSNLKIELLQRETFYNKVKFFTWSIIFYIVTLFLLLLKWLFRRFSYIGRQITKTVFAIGFLFHTTGLILRMSIMQRPPVSTLYESIIFVAFIAILFSIIIEIIRKDNLGLFMGSVVGIVLHFIAMGYAADGKTLEVLVAVLNSNFWLATHVTTITTGYGICIVTSLIGHWYLLKANFDKNNTKYLNEIYKNMFGMTLIALFFTTFGTILGGIWGDQSWGRFWGWDPKENGALLIVMWLLMMIHMKVSGLVQAKGFALGMVILNICVALAWFGVNLLNVGLHSYGFTDGVALNLFIFVLIELFFGLILFSRLIYKSK